MMEKVFHVEGMMCEHCENRVTKALMQIEGVQACHANAKDKTVVCSFDPAKTEEALIASAIEDSGYDVIKEG